MDLSPEFRVAAASRVVRLLQRLWPAAFGSKLLLVLASSILQKRIFLVLKPSTLRARLCTKATRKRSLRAHVRVYPDHDAGFSSRASLRIATWTRKALQRTAVLGNLTPSMFRTWCTCRAVRARFRGYPIRRSAVPSVANAVLACLPKLWLKRGLPPAQLHGR